MRGQCVFGERSETKLRKQRVEQTMILMRMKTQQKLLKRGMISEIKMNEAISVRNASSFRYSHV
jgi:hypothetical protein